MYICNAPAFQRRFRNAQTRRGSIRRGSDQRKITRSVRARAYAAISGKRKKNEEKRKRDRGRGEKRRRPTGRSGRRYWEPRDGFAIRRGENRYAGEIKSHSGCYAPISRPRIHHRLSDRASRATYAKTVLIILLSSARNIHEPHAGGLAPSRSRFKRARTLALMNTCSGCERHGLAGRKAEKSLVTLRTLIDSIIAPVILFPTFLKSRRRLFFKSVA